MSNSRYAIGESVTAYNVNNYLVATARIDTVSNSSAVLTYVNESFSNTYTEFRGSTGGFSNNQVIHLVGNDPKSGNPGTTVTANVISVEDYNYSTIDFNPKVLNFIKTTFDTRLDTYDSGCSNIFWIC
jgi:hypothetical protein